MAVTEETTVEPQQWTTTCSFCQKPHTEVATVVAGAGVFICNECVALCVEIIENKPKDMPALPSWEERLSDDDLLDMLPKVAAISQQVEHQLAHAVAHARGRGITWTRIGAALGMTRQSAWERFSGEE
jgi:hypothetical protein